MPNNTITVLLIVQQETVKLYRQQISHTTLPYPQEHLPDSTAQGNYLCGTPPLFHSCETDPITVTPTLPLSSGKVRSFQHHLDGLHATGVQYRLLSASLAKQSQKRHSTERVQTTPSSTKCKNCVSFNAPVLKATVSAGTTPTLALPF